MIAIFAGDAQVGSQMPAAGSGPASGAEQRRRRTWNASTFDQSASTLDQPQGRRATLRLLGAALLGAGADAAPRKKGYHHHHPHGHGGDNEQCLHAGAFCDTDKQCCPDKTKRICDVLENASNSDTTCCGGEGAICGGMNKDGDQPLPFCCVGQAGVRSFVCSESDPNNPGVRGTCLPALDEE